jgi:hypothetical protein
MTVKTVILETLGMMGFAFLVGIGVAYVIKILVEIFHFFRKEHLASVVSDYKIRLFEERRRRMNMKRMLLSMEKDSDVELLKYLYENKDKHNSEEEVKDLYNLFDFYRGIYKDKNESDGINELFKYYNGEV